MLKLLIFAACEKVIEGKDETASLISVMESVQIIAPDGMPPDALAPIKWGVLALWRREGEVEGEVEFEQKIDVERPDGTMAVGGTILFKVSNNHLNFRNRLELPVLPIGQEGDVLVKVRLRQLNPETEWHDRGEYPVRVIHMKGVVNEESTTDNAEVG